MHGTQVDFHVQSGQAHVTVLRQRENRGDCAVELLCDRVANWPGLFEGREASGTLRTGQPGRWLPFPDLSDLLEHTAKLEGEPDPCAAIGMGAREFAARRLGGDARLTHTAEQLHAMLAGCGLHSAATRKNEKQTLKPCLNN